MFLVRRLQQKVHRGFSTLLIAETRAGNLLPGNLNALTAAMKLNKDIDILVLGSQAKDIPLRANLVKDVFVANGPEFLNPTADIFSQAVNNFIQKQNKYKHVVAVSSTWSKDYLPRLAALNECQPISEVTDIVNENTFKRPIYAGNAISTVKSNNPIHFVAFRPTNFDAFAKPETIASKVVNVADLLNGINLTQSQIIKEEFIKSERPELTDAKIVVSGGRGI